MNRVVLVDDEPDIVDILSLLLSRDGFDVITFSDGRSALAAMQSTDADLIILDWNLPDMEGLDVCLVLRREGLSTPIMLLTARDNEFDKIVAFEAGADDYVTKPFSLLEFLGRCRAIIRRCKSDSSLLVLGDLTIDQTSRQVNLGGEVLPLTPKEYSLLVYLAERAGKAVTRKDLLSQVWGYEFYGNTRTVDVHISRLRGKLGDDYEAPSRIITVKSVGYKLISTNGTSTAAMYDFDEPSALPYTAI